MKFQNIHTKTGQISFNGARISFDGILETEDKELAKSLEESSNWVNLEPKKNIDEELEALKVEAKELGLEFHPKTGAKKLLALIEEFKKKSE